MDKLTVTKKAIKGQSPVFSFAYGEMTAKSTDYNSLSTMAEALQGGRGGWRGVLSYSDVSMTHTVDFFRGSDAVEAEIVGIHPGMTAAQALETVMQNIRRVQDAFDTKYPAIEDTASAWVSGSKPDAWVNWLSAFEGHQVRVVVDDLLKKNEGDDSGFDPYIEPWWIIMEPKASIAWEYEEGEVMFVVGTIDEHSAAIKLNDIIYLFEYKDSEGISVTPYQSDSRDGRRIVATVKKYTQAAIKGLDLLLILKMP